MAFPVEINLVGAKIPTSDGEINEYIYTEARASTKYNPGRKVIFINGMDNTGAQHAESALALSWVQMCCVIGVYNATGGVLEDFLQCIGDKNQFNGPISNTAPTEVRERVSSDGQTPVEAARQALSRNRAQVKLFDLLRRPDNRSREIFAHSQGNLILSNVLQAIAAVDGSLSLSGRIIHTFGSPVVNWPGNITKYEHAFTWDPVAFLAGFDTTFTISKVGMPSDSMNPITHGFLEYLKSDPAFIVNRFRWGGVGITFSMDERGLAKSLVAMGTNTGRVLDIFKYLNHYHNSDADDVAVLYVNQVKNSPSTLAALKSNTNLVGLLIRIMDEGWTGKEEKEAIKFLKEI